MHTERLFASLSRAWHHAVTVSNAADLPREYVNVLLPLMPEAAESILRALQGSEAYAEEWLLREHAPLLARHARALMFERVFAVSAGFSPVELLARAAVSFPLDERGPFRDLALPAIAPTRATPTSTIEALLAWSDAEPPEGRDALVAEALALLPDVPDFRVAVFRAPLRRQAAPDDRETLRARVDAIADAEPTSEHLLMRCELAPPEGRADLANEAVELACATDRRRYFTTALNAERLTGFEAMRPHYERHLRELDTLRELAFLLNKIGALVEMLDLARATHPRARRRGGAARNDPGRALAAPRDAARGPARRAPRARRARGGQPGARASHEAQRVRDLRQHRPAARRRGHARERGLRGRRAALVSTARAGPRRAHRHGRRQRLRARHHSVGRARRTSTLTLRRGSRVALSMRHRPRRPRGRRQARGEAPASAKRLALLGLARLADGGAPERLPDALAALDIAARLPPERAHEAPPAATAPSPPGRPATTTPCAPSPRASSATP